MQMESGKGMVCAPHHKPYIHSLFADIFYLTLVVGDLVSDGVRISYKWWDQQFKEAMCADQLVKYQQERNIFRK